MISTNYIPSKPMIESDHIPIEWLHELAVREGNSKKPIYQIHKWWARRLGCIFRALLLMAINDSTIDLEQEFYKRHTYTDMVVLDPFMGGGTSVVEATKIGARTIGVDIDPVAWFTTKKEIEPFDKKKILEAYTVFEASIGKVISSYYITKSGDRFAPVTYYFWVDLINCPNCHVAFETHPHYILSLDKTKEQQTVFCKRCHNVSTITSIDNQFVCPKCKELTIINSYTIQRGKFECPECRHRGSILSTITPGHPLEKRMFALEYIEIDLNGKKKRQYKPIEQFDLELYRNAQEKFEEIKGDILFPHEKIPTEKRNDARPINYGFEYYSQLFNTRQLLCLSMLWKEIQSLDKTTQEYFIIAFSDSLASNNMLCRYAFGYQKLTPLFGLHAYDIVHRPVENNVWGTTFGRGSFSKCFLKMVRGKEYSLHPFEFLYENGHPKRVYTKEKVSRKVSIDIGDVQNKAFHCILLNRSSLELDSFPEKYVDLILTDPPYFDNLSYSELSDFFFVWIKDHMPKDGNGHRHMSTPYQKALFANNKTNNRKFVDDLAEIFRHCRRVLKPNGLMVFTFHHRKLQAWTSLAIALAIGGFQITNIFPVRSEGNSGFHSTEGTIKWDSVIVCRYREETTENVRNQIDIEHIISRLKYWQDRIEISKFNFRWVDSLSLGYALLVQQILTKNYEPTEFGSVMVEVNEELMKRLKPGDIKNRALINPGFLPYSSE